VELYRLLSLHLLGVGRDRFTLLQYPSHHALCNVIKLILFPGTHRKVTLEIIVKVTERRNYQLQPAATSCCTYSTEIFDSSVGTSVATD